MEDENNRGTLYLLSCHQVLNHSAERVVHPGLNDYLNKLKWILKTYEVLVSEIPGPHRMEVLKSLNDQETAEELSSKFREVEKIKGKHLKLLQNDQLDTDTIDFPNVEERSRFHCYYPGDEGRGKQLLSSLLQKDTVTELPMIEVKFERCLRTYQPRHVARYTTGIGGNLSHGDKKYFIDAAIAELNPGEVKKLKSIKIVGTIHYPSGKCIPATTRDLTNARELCKSGRTTGYTTSKSLVRKPEDASVLLQSSAIAIKSVVSDLKKFDYFCQDCVEKQQNDSEMIECKQPAPSCEGCDDGKSVFYQSRWLSNCLCIRNEPDQFAKSGDSGALFFEKCEGSPSERGCLSGFGVLFGIFYSGNHICALASPLEIALKELSKEVWDNCHLKVVSNDSLC